MSSQKSNINVKKKTKEPKEPKETSLKSSWEPELSKSFKSTMSESFNVTEPSKEVSLNLGQPNRQCLNSIFNYIGSFQSVAPNSSFSVSNSMALASLDSLTDTSPSQKVVHVSQMVKLNVYGLPNINQIIRYTGLGVYHSGVEVYNNEWAYGGYPYPVCSIFKMRKPRDLESLSDINGKFQFVQTIEIGTTNFTLQEIKTIIKNLGSTEWIGTNYHLLYRNCNNFSDELCKLLCNKPIPTWVNRLASIFAKFPFLVRMMPDEYFTPVALKQKLKKEQTLKYQLYKSACADDNGKTDEKVVHKTPKSNASVLHSKSVEKSDVRRILSSDECSRTSSTISLSFCCKSAKRSPSSRSLKSLKVQNQSIKSSITDTPIAKTTKSAKSVIVNGDKYKPVKCPSLESLCLSKSLSGGSLLDSFESLKCQKEKEISKDIVK